MGQLESVEALLRMERISKAFPGVLALDRVDFELLPGEVHALMGENGAGKSTLIRVLTGVHPADSGQILLGGEDIAPTSPLEAQALGVSTVYQEVQLIPQLTVAENITLGRQPTRAGLLSWAQLYRQAANALQRVGLQIDLDCDLGSYSTAIQQMVAIARALDMNARVLVLDEPTSSLDENEVAELLQVMRRLKNQGLGMIFVTHFLEQAYEIADRITVLRNGQRVDTCSIQELPRIELIGKMLGKQPEDVAESPARSVKEPAVRNTSEKVVEAHKLERKGAIRPFDLHIDQAEILGFAGLLGAGRTEAARLLFGARSRNGR